MSAITLFTRQAPTLGGFQFDAVLEDKVEIDAEFPDYPIETGARVVDHRVIKPIRYTLVGAMSNNPLRPLPTDFLMGIASEAVRSNGLLSFAAGLSTGFLSGSPLTRASSAFELLTEILANAMPFDVDAVDIQLQNMVIESLRRTRNPENENGLVFIAELRELITVDRISAGIRSRMSDMADGDPAQSSAISEASRGQVAGETVNGTIIYQVQELRDIQGVPL